jgi:hypothetical protein
MERSKSEASAILRRGSFMGVFDGRREDGRGFRYSVHRERENPLLQDFWSQCKAVIRLLREASDKSTTEELQRKLGSSYGSNRTTFVISALAGARQISIIDGSQCHLKNTRFTAWMSQGLANQE